MYSNPLLNTAEKVINLSSEVTDINLRNAITELKDCIIKQHNPTLDINEIQLIANEDHLIEMMNDAKTLKDWHIIVVATKESNLEAEFYDHLLCNILQNNKDLDLINIMLNLAKVANNLEDKELLDTLKEEYHDGCIIDLLKDTDQAKELRIFLI